MNGYVTVLVLSEIDTIASEQDLSSRTRRIAPQIREPVHGSILRRGWTPALRGFAAWLG